MSELDVRRPSSTIVVGVDTHKYVHVAVAIDHLGTRLASCSVSADRAGYTTLVTWAQALGPIQAFGIEGTGSYGVGLASYVRRHALRVVEVSHADRRKRRSHGKSDTLDAETAARSVLPGVARQANAALYRIVTVRLRWHQPTIEYVTRRTAQGLSKRDMIRCLKRFVAREIYHALLDDHAARLAAPLHS